MAPNFPLVDRNRIVSRASKDIFALQCPATWTATPIDQVDDFGIDYQVQVAPGEQVQHFFLAQLKGTERPTILNDSITLTIELSRRTLNLYTRTRAPVMLLVAVVQIGENNKVVPDRSKVYWQWMTSELERIRGSRFAVDETTQESVTVHVPLSNELTPDTDIVPYLNESLHEEQLNANLADLVRTAGAAISPPMDDPIHRLTALLVSQPTRLSLLFAASSTDELPASDTPYRQELEEAAAHVKAGRTDLAERVLRGLDESKLDTTPEMLASVLFLKGKVAFQRARTEDAKSLFVAAHIAHSSEKYLVAAGELDFLRAVDEEDRASLQRVVGQLAGAGSDDAIALLVRVKVSLGELDEAAGLVAKLAPPRRTLSELVLLSGQGKWQDVRTVADHALADPGLSLFDRTAYQLLAARACWHQALSAAAVPADATELPLSGPPGFDIEAARASWQYCNSCLQGLKELGWSMNVELLAPVATATAAALGKSDQAMVLLAEAARARPEYVVLQENVELLAISMGNHELALQANARQPASQEALVRRACMLFEAGKYDECLVSALQVAAQSDDSCPQKPMALALGAAAATRMARTGDAAVLIAALTANEAWDEFAVLARFAQVKVNRPDDRSTLSILRDGLAKHPTSHILAANLFSNLDLDDSREAAEAVSLFRRLADRAAPTFDEWMRAILAELTLGNWDAGEEKARLAISRFGEFDKLVSLLAVALEMQGKTGEALATMERALTLGHQRLSMLRTYLGICLRLGRITEARSTIEKMLVHESDKHERIELLRLNALMLAQQGDANGAVTIVDQLASLVDSNVEQEEGIYVNSFMAVTIHAPNVAPQSAAAFRERMERFCAKWPDSQLFRRVELPPGGIQSPDELHKMFDGVIGDSKAALEQFQERERLARAGKLPIPFLARPCYVFHYIGDCFTLWGLAKSAGRDYRQFQLTMTFTDDPPATNEVLSKIPLMDLTSLLVLNDLMLLPTLLRLFPRIAIPRTTVAYIGQNARSLIANRAGIAIAGPLLHFINENLDHIEQPAAHNLSVANITPQGLVTDYAKLAATHRWAVYSDDAITRALIRREDDEVVDLCTLDFLSLAEEGGLMAAGEVGQRLSQLAHWNVGITVRSRFFLALVNKAIGDNSNLSASQRLDRLHGEHSFSSLARALWYPEKAPRELIAHVGSIVAEALGRSDTDDRSVVALWAFWFIRVRMTFNFNQLGWAPLCYSLVIALLGLAPHLAYRAVSGFLQTVDLATPVDRMSNAVVSEAVRELGIVIGGLYRGNSAGAEGLRAKVATTLRRGTVEGDIFNEAYLAAISSLDQESRH